MRSNPTITGESPAEPAISRRCAANRRKLAAWLGNGFLPEERPGEAPWVWNQHRGPSSPAEGPTHVGRSPDRPASTPHPSCNGSDAAIELYQIESMARAALDGAPPFAPTDVAEQLLAWLKTSLSSEGVLVESPWLTHSILPPLTRMRQALAGLGWTDQHETWFRAALGMSFRTATARGWLVGPSKIPSKPYRDLLARLSREVGLRSWYNVPRWLWGEHNRFMRCQPPAPGMQSDEAGIAVLRADWSSRGAVLALDHRSSDCILQLDLLGRCVLDGPWETTVRCAGRAIGVQGVWESTCWFSDGDGEYLEQRLELEEGLSIERQLYLARRPGLWWASDTLKPPPSAAATNGRRRADEPDLEILWKLPLVEAKGLLAAGPTRARIVQGFDFELRVVPVALPSHPLDLADGSMSLEPGGLHLSVRGRGGPVVLPALLAWDPRPLPPQPPWRQLTITNDRRLVPPNEAVAFRVPHQAGQLVFFRALAQPRRYAFLGHQYLSECVIGSFDPKKGHLSPWLLVDADETDTEPGHGPGHPIG